MLRVLPPTFEPLTTNKIARFVFVGGKTRSSYRPTAWLKRQNPNTLFSLPRRRSLGPLGFVSRSFFAKKKKTRLIWQMKVNFPGVASEFLGIAPTFGKRTERFVVECSRPPNNLSRTRRPCTKKRSVT